MTRPLNRRDFLRMLSVGLGLSPVVIPMLGRPVLAHAAIEILGGTQYVDFGDLAAFDNPTTLSYCFWLYHAGTLGSGADHGLLAKGTSFYAYAASTGANNLAAGVSGVSERRTGAGVIPNALWTHCGFIYDSGAGAGNILKILAGGVNQSLSGVEPSFPDQGGGVFTFGNALTVPTAQFALFKVWTAALSIQEMQNEMLSHRPQRTANLVLWCSGEDGNRMTDYSGAGRHGVLTNGARLSSLSPPIGGGD